MHKNTGVATAAASPPGLPLLVLLLCFFFNFIGRGVGDTYMVFLLPLGAEFGWHRSQMTSVYSMLMVVSGLASPLSGIVFERWGARVLYGAGLALLRAGEADPAALIDAYRSPMPSLALGHALAPLVSAMADVSDGLLIDAQRIAHASGCGVEVMLDAVPLSPAFVAARGDDVKSRLFAATSGDDYRLIFTAKPAQAGAIAALSTRHAIPLSRVGHCVEGGGLRLLHGGVAVPLPARLGYEHAAALD